MATHSSIPAWRIHGHRILAGYSPWGRKETDMTEQLTVSLLLGFEPGWSFQYVRGGVGVIMRAGSWIEPYGPPTCP